MISVSIFVMPGAPVLKTAVLRGFLIPPDPDTLGIVAIGEVWAGMDEAGHRQASDPIGVRFLGCEAGWIRFRIDALSPAARSLMATHLDDPFPRMIEWLEEICDGARLAMWDFAQEGTSARLIFAEVGRNFLGGGSDRLMLIDDGTHEHFATARVERLALAREFYDSFRAFSIDGYIPEQWEYGLPIHLSYQDLTDEEEDHYWNKGLISWDGYALRGLRSSKVESFLRGAQAEQLDLNLRHPEWPLLSL